MAVNGITRVAWMAVVCMGLFAMPSLANPSVLGNWVGSCVQTYDYNVNCVKGGHVAAYAFYLNIAKAGSKYQFTIKADPAIVTGGAKLPGYTDKFVLPISGDPLKGAYVADPDEIHDSFSLSLQRIGGNDILIYSTDYDASEGPQPPTNLLFDPLFCNPKIEIGGQNSQGNKGNQICTLFRKK